MTREEQKTNAAIEMYPAGTQNSLQFRVCFATGVDWADQNPRKGLWEAEKVINFLKERATLENSSNINIHINGATYHFVNDFIEDLRKAMEEIQ